MIRLLADINLRGEIVSGIRRRDPSIEIVRAQDVGLDGISDEQVLQWAAEQSCILATHDRTTIPTFAWARVEAGASMPGVFILSNSISTAEAIDQLPAIATCSRAEDWENRVEFLPF